MAAEQRARKERKGNADKRRRQILDAVYRSVVRHGLARTTLATIADEAGLSQGVAVFYFKTKNGVLSEALRDLYETYTTHWQNALAEAEPDPVCQLAAIIAADFAPVVCNPSTLSVWFAFWGEQKFIPQYAEITAQFSTGRTRALLDIFTQLVPGDEARARDLAEWVDTLTDGYWQNQQLLPESFDPERAKHATLRFLCAVLPDYAERLEACWTES